jgi:hypothetical protein
MLLVKILPAAAGFNAVRYNADKITINRAELIEAAGFNIYKGFSKVQKQDYVNYFGLLASLNAREKKPQFHAVLSAVGTSWDKMQLGALAGRWLELMGYGQQPYLLVFHKDTANNHIHMVSVRVNRQGKRIFSFRDYRRAQEKLSELLGIDQKERVNQAIGEALGYQIRSRSEFRALMLYKGYLSRENSNEMLELIRNGRVQAMISIKAIDEKIDSNKKMNAIDHLLLQYPEQAQKLKAHTRWAGAKSKTKRVFGSNILANPEIVVLIHYREAGLYGSYSLVWPQAGLIVNEKEFCWRMEQLNQAKDLQQSEFSRGWSDELKAPWIESQHASETFSEEVLQEQNILARGRRR